MKIVKKSFVLFFALLVFLTVPVKAMDVATSEDTKYDIEDSNLSAGDNVTSSDSIFGSSLVAGNNVNNSGVVDGVLIAAGNTVKDEGNSEYAILAGNSVDVSGKYSRDVLIAGNNLSVYNNTSFGRDVFIFGNIVDLSGTIDRNITIYASSVTLDNVSIVGNAKIMADSIIIKDNVKINGELTYSASDSNEISSNAFINSKKEVEVSKSNNFNNYFSELLSKVISYVSLLLVFAVVALLIPKMLEKTSKESFDFMKILGLCGNGLLLLVLVPMGLVILFTLVIGIPLGMIILALYLVALYLSNALTGYYVGKAICDKWFKKNDNVLTQGLIGITLLFVLSLIPVLGVFTVLISFLTGLGLIVDTLKKE